MRHLLICIAALTSSVAAHGGFDVPYSQRYDAWARQYGVPVSALHTSTNPPPSLTPQQVIQRYRGSGMNQFTGLGGSNSFNNFSAAENAGYAWQADVKNVATMSAFQDEVNLAVSIGKGPTAMRIFDEPGESDIATIAERVQWMRNAGIQQGFNETGVPSPLIFANLSLLDVDVDNYIEQVDPDVLCYTGYPHLLDGTTDDNHFEFMGVARTASLEHNVPLWMFQQAFSRTESGNGILYRLPSESDMRFQAFSFLGHGGLGIRYFTYIDTNEFPVSIIDGTTNQPTAVYGHIQAITPEISNLAKSLPILRPVDDVTFVGQALTDFDATTLFTGRGALRDVTGAQSVQVSFFEDGAGESYFMIVNLQHGPDATGDEAADTVRLWFDPNVLQIERLSRLTGEIELLDTSFALTERYLDVTLPGGTGDLFKYHTGAAFAMIPEPSMLMLTLGAIMTAISRRLPTVRRAA